LASIDAPPTRCSSSLKSPTFLSTFFAAFMISGPMPSPGSTTIRPEPFSAGLPHIVSL
jgi:hypothetical protein